MQHDQAVLFPIGQESKRRVFVLGAVCALTVACLTLAAAPAQARVTKIQITTKESPTFGGYSWPGVGQYEKIVGKAFGELDPNDPKNAVIVDLQLAPRNASGKVEYSFDFYILKPIDLSKGNHKMLYEPPNRGGKTIAALNRGVGGNDPGSVTDPSLLGELVPDAAGLFDIVQRLGSLGGNELRPISIRPSRCRSPGTRMDRRSPVRPTNTS